MKDLIELHSGADAQRLPCREDAEGEPTRGERAHDRPLIVNILGSGLGILADECVGHSPTWSVVRAALQRTCTMSTGISLFSRRKH